MLRQAATLVGGYLLAETTHLFLGFLGEGGQRPLLNSDNKVTALSASTPIVLGGVSYLLSHEKSDIYCTAGGSALFLLRRAVSSHKARKRESKEKPIVADTTVAPSQQIAQQVYPIESTTPLSHLLRQSGVSYPKLPRTFKAVVDVYDLNDPNNGVRYFWSDRNTDAAISGWVPASSVKIFAALGALKKLTDLGFTSDALITFMDKNQTTTARELVNKALLVSDNMAYNRLVQLAGHESLNTYLQQAYPNTELNKPYIAQEWKTLTGGNDSFAAPEIQITDAQKTVVLPPTSKRSPVLCSGPQACTSLIDLNQALLEICILGNIGLSKDNYDTLYNALAGRKSSGEDLARSLMSRVSNYNFVLFGKHGFNGEWYSQAFALIDVSRSKAYIVSAVGCCGDRSQLNSFGYALGDLINSGAL